MRRHRFFCSTDVTAGSELDLPADVARHINQVLRLRVDDAITLFDGNGVEFECRLVKVGKSGTRVSVGDMSQPETESPLKISLWHGICRGQRMDVVVQKATELGVSDIQPMFTTRGVVKLDSNRAAKRLEHWQKVAISAAEQSGRCRVPKLVQPLDIAKLLDNCTAESTKIIFDPSGEQRLADLLQKDLPIILCTGPEGGFTENELAHTESAGFQKVALGPRILRTETAPIVALTLVQHLIGDMGAPNPGL